MVGILTHGTFYDEVTFSDNETENFKKIVQRFNNKDCPALMNKPKIFMFPCCRGSKPDPGVARDLEHQNKLDALPQNSLLTDVLISYATVPGYATLREPSNGCWYIKILCEVFFANAHNTDIEEMFAMVTAKFIELSFEFVEECSKTSSNYRQTPQITRYDFNNVLFFNPGYPSTEPKRTTCPPIVNTTSVFIFVTIFVVLLCIYLV